MPWDVRPRAGGNPSARCARCRVARSSCASVPVEGAVLIVCAVLQLVRLAAVQKKTDTIRTIDTDAQDIRTAECLASKMTTTMIRTIDTNAETVVPERIQKVRGFKTQVTADATTTSLHCHINK